MSNTKEKASSCEPSVLPGSDGGPSVGFDEYAVDYDNALAQGLAVSGEDKHYFASGRVAWLAQCLRQFPDRPECVLDFGCGTGTSTPLFFDLLGVESVIGLDASTKSLEMARGTYGGERVQFSHWQQYPPWAQNDLAFCNGVFHHIPLMERAATVNYIYRCLRPGGMFALWENNPWNPGTRYVMSRIPFDRDAIMLSPPGARRLVRAGGFEVLRTDFLFIFPRALSSLRWIEPFVSRLPLGGQYQILCRKPVTVAPTA